MGACWCATCAARPAPHPNRPVSNYEGKPDTSHTTAIRKRGEREHTIWIGDGRELHELSTTSREGKVLVLKLVEPGEVMGLSAVISEEAYEVTAETIGALSG
jgi:hypothetical protein